MSEPMLDAAGRRRSPATLPEFHAGRPPRNPPRSAGLVEEQHRRCTLLQENAHAVCALLAGIEASVEHGREGGVSLRQPTETTREPALALPKR